MDKKSIFETIAGRIHYIRDSIDFGSVIKKGEIVRTNQNKAKRLLGKYFPEWQNLNEKIISELFFINPLDEINLVSIEDAINLNYAQCILNLEIADFYIKADDSAEAVNYIFEANESVVRARYLTHIDNSLLVVGNPKARKKIEDKVIADIKDEKSAKCKYARSFRNDKATRSEIKAELIRIFRDFRDSNKTNKLRYSDAILYIESNQTDKSYELCIRNAKNKSKKTISFNGKSVTYTTGYLNKLYNIATPF